MVPVSLAGGVEMRRYPLIISGCLSLLLVLMIAGEVFAAFLTFVEFHQDNAGGVDGLTGAISVTVSPSQWSRSITRAMNVTG